MPRIRTIKPQFFLDEDLGTICRDARLMFVGLWNLADDSGVFEWRPLKIKAQLFPYDEDITAETIEGWLRQLVKIGDISEPFANGKKRFGFIYTLTKHQMIQHPSKYRHADVPPELLEKSATIIKQQGLDLPITDGDQRHPEHIDGIFELWNSQGMIKHKKLTGEIQRAIEIRLKDFSVEDISQAIKNYAEIVKGEQYFFKYRWTLKDFLKRGLEKFMDLEIAKQNHKIDVMAGKHKATRQEDRGSRYQATD